MKKFAIFLIIASILLAGCTQPKNASNQTNPQNGTLYSNAKYGFSLVLPAGWTAKEYKEGLVGFTSPEFAKFLEDNRKNCLNKTPGSCDIELASIPYDISFSNTTGVNNSDVDTSSVKKVIINDIEFTSYSEMGMIPSEHFEVQFNGKIYNFRDTSDNKAKQLLSTFMITQ